MQQSTKLFIVLGFLFVLFATMKGNLERYLQILFKSKDSGGVAGLAGGVVERLAGMEKELMDRIKF